MQTPLPASISAARRGFIARRTRLHSEPVWCSLTVGKPPLPVVTRAHLTRNCDSTAGFHPTGCNTGLGAGVCFVAGAQGYPGLPAGGFEAAVHGASDGSTDHCRYLHSRRAIRWRSGAGRGLWQAPRDHTVSTSQPGGVGVEGFPPSEPQGLGCSDGGTSSVARRGHRTACRPLRGRHQRFWT